MEKPDNYNFYINKKNNIPYKEWPREVKDYLNWKRRQRSHPEWANISEDERKEKVKEIKRKNIQKYKEKWETMSDGEKAEINKKKGSHYNNLSEEDKLKQNEVLKLRSRKFWDSLGESQRKEFGQYRWNKNSEETKREIIRKFVDGGKKHRESLTDEDIQLQIKRMNDAWKEKYNNDKNFKNQNNRLLRENNEKYFESLGEEGRLKFFEENGKRLGELAKERWENLSEEERKNKINHLREISSKYYNSLSEEGKRRYNERLKQNMINYFDNINSENWTELNHNNRFNKRFENQFKNSILINDFYFIKEYKVEFKDRVKFWDYGIFNKDNKLVAVVDLDGMYYHGDREVEYDGLHSKEERDENRSYFIPDNTKCIIITDTKFIDGFEKLLEILIEDYDEYLNNLFKEYRAMPFPYPEYSDKELITSFEYLKRMKCDDKYHKDISLNTRIGDHLIYHFHKSIYHAHRKNKMSPYDAWYDDECLKRCIKNRILYRTYIDSNKILQGFNISKIAQKVSVFSAGRAKLLIYKYLNEYDEIFDPFSGFSGRMLGTVSLGKKYIGQDLSEIHIYESNKLIEFLYRYFNFDANILCKDVLKSSGTYECLFTCPPYNDIEIWEDVNPINKSCDEWIDICLNNFKCKKYLFVVDNTNKYKDFIVDEIINKSHMNQNKEYVIMIDGN